MQKINYSDISNQQRIDLRHQHAYQAGHLKGSINLTIKNFKKLAPTLLQFQQPLLFIVDEEDVPALPSLKETAISLGFTQVANYLLFSTIPNQMLEKSMTILATDFLKQKEDNFLLLDVRDQTTVTVAAPTNHLVTLQAKNLADDYTKLDPNKTIYTLCGSGNSATTAASYLQEKGFHTVIIEGGAKAIEKAEEKSE